MLPDRVSNPGPLTCESGALPIALHSPRKIPALTQTDKSPSVPDKNGNRDNLGIIFLIFPEKLML